MPKTHLACVPHFFCFNLLHYIMDSMVAELYLLSFALFRIFKASMRRVKTSSLSFTNECHGMSHLDTHPRNGNGISVSLRLSASTRNWFSTGVICPEVESSLAATGGRHWILVAIGGRCCVMGVSAGRDKITGAIGYCRESIIQALGGVKGVLWPEISHLDKVEAKTKDVVPCDYIIFPDFRRRSAGGYLIGKLMEEARKVRVSRGKY
ncbi:hypothetical protein DFH06DRAFT_1131831 [Mycena polygramma]|nr:hypothetical protein DFH06DRAFT_1131831 [Mycena polygramma]